MIRRKVLAVKNIVACLFLVVLCSSALAQKPQTRNTTRDGWVLRFDGIGAVRVGMTVTQVNAALGATFSTPTGEGAQTYFYLEPKQHPDTAIMMLNGRVARVDVFAAKILAPGTATAAGVRIGDSEARVRNLYGEKITISPHEYTDGHYLTTRAGKYRLRFETDKNKVTRFYAGTLEAIALIEGRS